MLLSIVFCLLVLLASLLLYRRRQFVKQVNQLPGTKMIVGIIGDTSRSLRMAGQLEPTVFINEISDALALLTRNEAGGGLCVTWLGPLPMINVYSAEMAEQVLTASGSRKKGFVYDLMKPWLGNGLLTSHGTKWQSDRKKLTPAFHFRILQSFVPVMNRNAKILLQKLQQELQVAPDGTYSVIKDIRSQLLLCTLDVICETAMGKQLNAQMNPQNEYVRAVHRLQEITMERLFRPWLWHQSLFKWTALGRETSRLLQTLHSFTMQVIEERTKSALNRQNNNDSTTSMPSPSPSPSPVDTSVTGSFSTSKTTGDSSTHSTGSVNDDSNGFCGEANNNRPSCKEGHTSSHEEKVRQAFLDTLITEHLRSPSEFTLTDIREQVDTVMFGGHDTTAWTVVWVIYLLGLHPEVQEKVHLEVQSMFNGLEDGEFTLNDIRSNLPYTEAVIKESQRLYAPVPIIQRVTDGVTKLGHFTLPPGIQVAIHIRIVHKDPRHWPNPEKFIPERFLSGEERHPFAFIPFSAGQRNCIGQRFAHLETLALVASLVHKFTFTSLDARDKVIPASTFITKSLTPVRVKLQLRWRSVTRTVCRVFGQRNGTVSSVLCQAIGYS